MTPQQAETFELLGELLRHTREIASCRDDREVDVVEHSNRCRLLLDTLQEITRSRGHGLLGGGGSDDAEAKEKLACLLNKLLQHTQQSCAVLGELLKDSEAELTSLRLAQRQTQAYARQA